MWGPPPPPPPPPEQSGRGLGPDYTAPGAYMILIGWSLDMLKGAAMPGYLV